MKKIALLFPGQGSQYVGMGKNLYEKYKAAKETFEEANEALGFDLAKLCFEGNLEELTKTENTQPALLTSSVAAFKVYMQEFGITPAFMAGHSLGEFSALTCAGGMKFADAVKIVRARGRFMQEAVPIGVGAMAAISGASKSAIEEACAEFSKDGQMVVVSNYNSPEQIVISGHKEAVGAAGEKLKGLGGKVIPLKVSAPFHSPLMQPAADRLKEEMQKYEYGKLLYPVISNVTALPYKDQSEIIETLSQQIVKSVQWEASMVYMQNQGIELAIEMGPQNVLRNLTKKNIPGVEAYAYDKEEDVKVLKEKLGQPEQQGTAPKYNVLTRCLAIAVCTKNRNWDNDEYQKGVVEPYRKIRQLQEELEKEGKEPTKEQMQEALDMLRSVFTTKKTPVDEQIERFSQVFDETGTRSLFPDFKMPV